MFQEFRNPGCWFFLKLTLLKHQIHVMSQVSAFDQSKKRKLVSGSDWYDGVEEGIREGGKDVGKEAGREERESITQVAMTSPSLDYKTVRRTAQGFRVELELFEEQREILSCIPFILNPRIVYSLKVRMNVVQLVACGLIMSLVLVRTEARPTTPSQHKVRLWIWDLFLVLVKSPG